MILAIVGKTNSGKDYLAKKVREKYNIPFVCSYTTRPKRDYETNGVEHWFITEEEMKKIAVTENIVAETYNELTGVYYFATDKCLSNDCIYIINPDGIHSLKGLMPDADIVSVYVDTPECFLRKRGIARGDDPKVLDTRIASESEEFDNFKTNEEYDYIIKNVGTLEEFDKEIDILLKLIFSY